jgi:hypothetical protein
MSEETSQRPQAALMPSVLGMSSALIGGLSVLYSAICLLYQLPWQRVIWDQIGLRGTFASRFMESGYGRVLWIVTAVGTVASIALAWRRGGRSSTLAVNLGVMTLALVLAVLTKEATCGPMREFFRGLIPGPPFF